MLEPQNVNHLPNKGWMDLVRIAGPLRLFVLQNIDPDTGNIEFVGRLLGRMTGLTLSFSNAPRAVRLKLGDGGVMTGTYSIGPVRLSLR